VSLKEMLPKFVRAIHELARVRWFGPSWNSELCHTEEPAPTPVGEHCVHCEEPVLDGEQGFIYANGPASHRECFMRQITGSVAHQLKQCSCYVPGSTCGDPPELSRREAARQAVAHYHKMLGEGKIPG
jgi:hypothetical protein